MRDVNTNKGKFKEFFTLFSTNDISASSYGLHRTLLDILLVQYTKKNSRSIELVSCLAPMRQVLHLTIFIELCLISFCYSTKNKISRSIELASESWHMEICLCLCLKYYLQVGNPSLLVFFLFGTNFFYTKRCLGSLKNLPFYTLFNNSSLFQK